MRSVVVWIQKVFDLAPGLWSFLMIIGLIPGIPVMILLNANQNLFLWSALIGVDVLIWGSFWVSNYEVEPSQKAVQKLDDLLKDWPEAQDLVADWLSDGLFLRNPQLSRLIQKAEKHHAEVLKIQREEKNWENTEIRLQADRLKLSKALPVASTPKASRTHL